METYLKTSNNKQTFNIMFAELFADLIKMFAW